MKNYIPKTKTWFKKRMKKFFEWLYFEDEYKIVKIYSPVHFLVDSKAGSRINVFIIWDLLRIKLLLNRIILKGE